MIQEAGRQGGRPKDCRGRPWLDRRGPTKTGPTMHENESSWIGLVVVLMLAIAAIGSAIVGSEVGYMRGYDDGFNLRIEGFEDAPKQHNLGR